jgi:phage repressor protein C with HTH and peptisase S24 domain
MCVNLVNIIYVNSLRDCAVMDDMASRLRKAREKAGYKSARSAALKFGFGVSTYAAHENGQNEYDGPKAEEYAAAFKTSAAHLLVGDKSAPPNYVADVVGIIGAGAEIEPEEPPPHGLYPINADIPLPEGSIGFEVQGDSLWPRYDSGDVIICRAEGVDPEKIPDGEEVAVRTEEGRRYVKRLVRTTVEGLFTLESHNAAPIRNVRIAWASDISTVVRARKWRKITPKPRRGAAR